MAGADGWDAEHECLTINPNPEFNVCVCLGKRRAEDSVKIIV